MEGGCQHFHKKICQALGKSTWTNGYAGTIRHHGNFICSFASRGNFRYNVLPFLFSFMHYYAFEPTTNKVQAI
jgi:hypothetical protein